MIAAVISDTHLPRRGRELPPLCVTRLRDADLIVHAGDLTTMAVLEELRGYGDVAAVHGNVDEEAVRRVLPARLEVALDGVPLGAIHDAGPRDGRLRRLRAVFPGVSAVIFGHSHIPLHETGAEGFQIFNPGSPTDRRRAPSHTMGLIRTDHGRLEFELVHLD